MNILPENFNENTFSAIGKDWMLIGACDGEKYNAMTASWGTFGVLWNKNVAIVFIRPERYTYEFSDKCEYLSLSFFDEQYKPALKLCGTKSGRDCDKIKEAGLTPKINNGILSFDEAKYTFTVRKLYTDDIKKANFLDEKLLENYTKGGYHKMYICEIINIEQK